MKPVGKNFRLTPAQIRRLVPNLGGCVATDRITVDGEDVGFLYRVEPEHDVDSGWRFLSGDESEAYMEDADNHGLYEVNTICNYDPSIIPLLDAPPGSAFQKDPETGRFIEVESVVEQ